MQGNCFIGYIVTQPVVGPGGVMVSNYQATGPQYGYLPPTSTAYPPASAGYPPSSAGYPPASGAYPQSSAGYQPYPTQQYTQTTTAQGGVTYHADYSQQKAGEGLGDAPPPYNPDN